MLGLIEKLLNKYTNIFVYYCMEWQFFLKFNLNYRKPVTCAHKSRHFRPIELEKQKP